ncbi:MAG: hypothetical protein IPK67_16440 [Planctomycetes bacterium]|jgi:3-oxoacyl-[acyl-carrier-protein] synthase-1|nr:hypothetical protein [Planctomycetota bacterium]
MSSAPAIHVRGVGLDCALGRDAKSCVDALAQGRVNTVEVELEGLLEPLRIHYYRIADGGVLFDPERFRPLITRVAREALDGADLSAAERRELPLFLGSSSFSFGRSEIEEESRGDHAHKPLLGFEHLARIVQEELDCGAEVFGLNTACTAAANALMVASRMLRLGIHRHALVLGVELANHTTLTGFSGLQLTASSVRPFDRRRAGIVLGEGIGAVVLSLDPGPGRIRLRAGACNGDAFSVTAANPDGSTIAFVQAQALAQAGVDPAQVRGIKTHGTASPMNDIGEAAGIRRLFPSPPPICALKPYLGHTLGACGVNELVLFAGALERGFFPATPGFEEADPELGLAPERSAREALPGSYLLNYFGFGGNNASLVVERT